jgi:tRNA-binding protein
MISFDDFLKIELCVGTILQAEDFPEARNPAYKLLIDMGPEIGHKRSSAQITKLYAKEELIGKQVVCVSNFPPKRIAGFTSEVLVTGFYVNEGEVALCVPDKPAPNGSRLA